MVVDSAGSGRRRSLHRRPDHERDVPVTLHFPGNAENSHGPPAGQSRVWLSVATHRQISVWRLNKSSPLRVTRFPLAATTFSRIPPIKFSLAAALRSLREKGE